MAAHTVSLLRHEEKVRVHADRRLVRARHLAGPALARELRTFLKVEDERLRIADQLGSNGHLTARARSFTVDLLVGHVFSRVCETAPLGLNGKLEDGVAIVALGGYGRDELAPFSDLDLLFLYGGQPAKPLRAAIERCLYPLWDSGLNVGQKSYAVDECVPASRTDPHFQTALVTARLVAGNSELFAGLCRALERERAKNVNLLLETIKRERAESYQKHGAAICLQEPNTKESAGGLRDLHSVLWATYARYGHKTLPALHEHGLIDIDQYERVSQAYDFLLRVRQQAHWITGRKTDHLGLDLQPALARTFGYASSENLQASEQFMRRYYRHARDLHQFSEWLFGRAWVPKVSAKRWYAPPRRKRVDELFALEDGQLQLEGEATLFTENPLLLFRALDLAQAANATLSQDLRDTMPRNLSGVDREFRHSSDVAQAFIALLSRGGRVGQTLRLMCEVGLLGRYLPEFERIRLLIQHDLYHHYTVDEHTLRAIEALDALHGSQDKGRALLRAALDEVKDVSLLYLALLLHDLGKGRGPGHIPRGANIAEHICVRLRLDEESKTTVVRLVKQHVLMAHLSQRRDLREPRLAADFAAQVGNLDVLNMLFLLTYADLNGVGPGVWSDWKGTLLDQLYTCTRPLLAERASELAVADHSAALKDQVIDSLINKCPVSEIQRHLALLPQRYLRAVTPETVRLHLQLVRQLNSEALACDWRQQGDFATELTICARDRHGLFADLAGALAANGIEILSADINTREDGIAIDSFILRSSATHKALDEHRLTSIERSLRSAMEGSADVAALVERWRTRHAPRHMRPAVTANNSKTPHVVCDNDVAEATTVVEIRVADEHGLAYKITRALAAFGLDIVCAKIATEKSDALDVFYVTNGDGSKLTDQQMPALEGALMEALAKYESR